MISVMRFNLLPSLRTSGDIDNSLNLLINEDKGDSIISIVDVDNYHPQNEIGKRKMTL